MSIRGLVLSATYVSETETWCVGFEETRLLDLGERFSIRRRLNRRQCGLCTGHIFLEADLSDYQRGGLYWERLGLHIGIM